MTHARIRNAVDANDISPRLATIPAMVKRTGLSERSVYRLLESGAVESVYVGRRRMVVLASLERFIDELPTQREA